MHSYYLLDHNYVVDTENHFGEFGHLLAFNPGPADLDLETTLYFLDREPERFCLKAPAAQSSESNYGNWPIQPGTRFALKVESPQPIICQSTVGWNVTLNDYSPSAVTKSPLGIRECAMSYMAINRLSEDWYLPDGIVLDMKDKIYVRESEYALLLNPNDQPTEVTLRLFYKTIDEHKMVVPARRLKAVYMDEIVRRNSHYGVHFKSDQPIAVQWQRSVRWYDNKELMAYWSVPCVPSPLV